MWGSNELDHEIAEPYVGDAHEATAGTLYIVSAPAGAYVRWVKPTIDRAFAATVLLLVLPIFIACAIAVRSNLGSPIFFTQVRVGHNGKRFKVYKFRTMKQDRRDRALLPEEELVVHDGFVGQDRRKTHKSAADPRLTGVGRFLRKWSLDELPQLWNVVRGDMSIIGPRPLPVAYLELYSVEQRRRHEVRPGLTGLAQSNGRNSVAWDQRFAWDVAYVDHASFLLDARIIGRSFKLVISRSGISADGHATAPEFLGSAALASTEGADRE